jgi:hypothetical protein
LIRFFVIGSRHNLTFTNRGEWSRFRDRLHAGSAMRPAQSSRERIPKSWSSATKMLIASR